MADAATSPNPDSPTWSEPVTLSPDTGIELSAPGQVQAGEDHRLLSLNLGPVGLRLTSFVIDADRPQDSINQGAFAGDAGISRRIAQPPGSEERFSSGFNPGSFTLNVYRADSLKSAPTVEPHPELGLVGESDVHVVGDRICVSYADLDDFTREIRCADPAGWPLVLEPLASHGGGFAASAAVQAVRGGSAVRLNGGYCSFWPTLVDDTTSNLNYACSGNGVEPVVFDTIPFPTAGAESTALAEGGFFYFVYNTSTEVRVLVTDGSDDFEIIPVDDTPQNAGGFVGLSATVDGEGLLNVILAGNHSRIDPLTRSITQFASFPGQRIGGQMLLVRNADASDGSIDLDAYFPGSLERARLDFVPEPRVGAGLLLGAALLSRLSSVASRGRRAPGTRS